jgi:hypothetical protein
MRPRQRSRRPCSAQASAIVAGIIAVLLGAVLVLFAFPRFHREQELLAEYHQDDVAATAATSPPNG